MGKLSITRYGGLKMDVKALIEPMVPVFEVIGTLMDVALWSVCIWAAVSLAHDKVKEWRNGR